jgi:hypothetical protein
MLTINGIGDYLTILVDSNQSFFIPSVINLENLTKEKLHQAFQWKFHWKVPISHQSDEL